MPSDSLSGRLSDAMRHVLMRRATIEDDEPIGGGFHLITLKGEALRNISWVPGQKVQIAMASAFETRTYTPIDWDGAAGRTRMLGFAHGAGPGSRWLRDARVGDSCDLFGPRGSIDARQLTGPLVLFGDETSIALAYALATQNPGRACLCHFEVGDADAAAKAVDRLGLSPAALYLRGPHDVQFASLEAALPALVASGVGFVLTGRAAMIQHLREAINIDGVPPSRVLTKAYWAPGKRGMD
jgi:NADPH-dependent ferric siderophore reductase